MIKILLAFGAGYYVAKNGLPPQLMKQFSQLGGIPSKCNCR